MQSTRTIQKAAAQLFRHQHTILPRQNVARTLHKEAAPPSLLRNSRPNTLRPANHRCCRQHRYESSSSAPRPLTDSEPTKANEEEVAARKAQEPAYEMTFTCRKCLERSSHRITKQAYHHGTTLITCPGCKNRHLISDHMKIFSDKSITLEDILREKGQHLQKGRLGEDGDIEFYDTSDTQA